MKTKRLIVGLAIVGGLAIIAAVGVGIYFVNSHDRMQAASSTMEPGLKVGDTFLADTRAYRSEEPQPGDVVVYRVPDEHATRPFVGRVEIGRASCRERV